MPAPLKQPLLTGLLAAAMAIAQAAGAAGSAPAHFITARGGRLWDGHQPFRFLSMNLPNLLLVEDNVSFAGQNPWRLPDAFEINDALATVAALGGTVTRTYVISVQRTNDPPGTPRHVLAPGRFNETAFRTLDEVLAAANRTGVRLIIPLVDNWPWMGGRAEYAGFRGRSKDDFWTDPQLLADFEQTIHFVVTRTNTVTGVRYADDKAILCWETGNELESPAAWTREIARYLKTLDPHHLVMDGFSASQLRAASLAMPEVDLVTTHHYPGPQAPLNDLIRANARHAAGKKAYVVGEFGFFSTAEMSRAMTAIRDSGAAGGLLWSLRFRNRDGGFYWHSEPGTGGNRFKAYHWPGSDLDRDYDEINLLALLRDNAFGLRNLEPPPIPAPAPPALLPVTDAAAISWRGSVGANGYQVERAASRAGDWRVIATNVDEAFTQYRPQFADENVPAGQWFYRVRARNAAGLSAPSNPGGPVTAHRAVLVDELADFSKCQTRTDGWKTARQDCRSALEDAHRAAGLAGDALIYEVPGTVQSFRVFALFPRAESAVKFSVSEDGRDFREVAAQPERYYRGAGEYDYWKPVLFHAEQVPGGRFFKLELTGETQIGRVEITHPALSP